ncbi:MAG: hypothetical protein AAGB11_11750 [Pseudomonadota bacterium]
MSRDLTIAASTKLDGGAVPASKAIRRLRWFITAFERQVDQTAIATGISFDVSQTALVQVFAEWIRAFDAQKPAADDDRRAYVGFAAGLMLRALMRRAPLTVLSFPPDADHADPRYFWPEGYVYTQFCLDGRGLVLKQDFDESQEVIAAYSDVEVWWSFKENAQEDTNLAIAYLEMFAGDEPHWSTPSNFFCRTTKGLSRIADVSRASLGA